MPARDPLSASDLEAALRDLEGWSLEADDDGSRIVRDFAFGDFRDGVGLPDARGL